MLLSAQEQSVLMKRFPPVELSYETVHKKVYQNKPPTDDGSDNVYDVALAIPYGKKSFLWCTYFQDQDVCFLLELGRDRRVLNMQLFHSQVAHPWVYGTVLYGVLVSENHFVVEDVLQSRGILLHKQSFGERLHFFREMMLDTSSSSSWCRDRVWLPVMWNLAHHPSAVPTPTPTTTPYVVHHVQYRSLSKIVPYVNVSAEDGTSPSDPNPSNGVVVEDKVPRCDYKKQQYKKRTVFYVKADMQFDLYRLYLSNHEYYGLAYIPNYPTSKRMNSLFRNIRENSNLDLLEESEDEGDFQDVRVDKYVDLQKCLKMECEFHAKFKRWVPITSVDAARAVISMSKL